MNCVNYITMGAIADGFSQYMMGWSTELLDACRKALEEDPQAQAVFFPPMEYGLQSGTGINRRIYQFNMSDYSLEDITGVVAEHAEDFARQYQIIRSPENEEKTELALANTERMEMGLAPKATLQAAKARSGQAQAFSLAAVTKEDVRLQCEWKDTASFVPVYNIPDQVGTSYGGNQNWFEAPYSGYNACGTVAACNVVCYMAHSAEKYKYLYPYSSIQFNDFYGLMKMMHSTYVKPGPFGKLSLNNWISDVVRYGNDFGVSLTSRSISDRATRDYCASHIKAGLKEDRPVAALNLSLNKGSHYSWHWVTITKYFQSTDNTRWIAVSSIGKRVSLDWDLYWQYANEATLPGGFVYFY